VALVKPFAVSASAVFLLALGCLAAGPAVAAPHPHKHAKCAKAQPGPEAKARFCTATIYEVADGTAPSGSKVRLLGVVSAVASSGERAWLAVEPGDPGYSSWEYSGVEIRLPRRPHPPKAGVGDRVAAYGTVTADGAGNWLDVHALSVESSGATVEPLDVADTALLSPSDPGPLDAVLVRVLNLTLATASPTEMTMTDGLALGNAIVGELPTIFSGPIQFESVTGIADTLGTGPPLLPRTLGDLHLGG
jgi:hypothetical protein